MGVPYVIVILGMFILETYGATNQVRAVRELIQDLAPQLQQYIEISITSPTPSNMDSYNISGT